mmetsp:Transcript_8912/g.26391  ORF Transcript_8912/g.26391 Transcript_8912/m.26391 type:complete len:272 (-) Transcript_8912:648-1463(-)
MEGGPSARSRDPRHALHRAGGRAGGAPTRVPRGAAAGHTGVWAAAPGAVRAVAPVEHQPLAPRGALPVLAPGRGGRRAAVAGAQSSGQGLRRPGSHLREHRTLHEGNDPCEAGHRAVHRHQGQVPRGQAAALALPPPAAPGHSTGRLGGPNKSGDRRDSPRLVGLDASQGRRLCRGSQGTAARSQGAGGRHPGGERPPARGAGVDRPRPAASGPDTPGSRSVLRGVSPLRGRKRHLGRPRAPPVAGVVRHRQRARVCGASAPGWRLLPRSG